MDDLPPSGTAPLGRAGIQRSARVAGSAGTGKTIVALHRAVWLARRYPDSRVLLTTFSEPLAHALKTRLNRLVGSAPRLAERIDVESLLAVGERLYRAQGGTKEVAKRASLLELIRSASEKIGSHKFTTHFLVTEWDQIVDAWQLRDWDDYREVPRLGRKTRLPEAQRQILWNIFHRVWEELSSAGQTTEAGVFTSLASTLQSVAKSPYDSAVVDEAQDISVAHVKFLAALAGRSENGLFFAGDLGQRIFQQPISWKSLGVDVRGHSRTLRVNYRTSHQIRMQADKLLGPELSDVDGNKEKRKDVVSVFNGTPPVVVVLEDEAREIRKVADWSRDRTSSGVLPHEIGIFVRSDAEFDRARKAVSEAGLSGIILTDSVGATAENVSIGTMHRAKGLEFRAVAVIACDDEVLPSQQRIETVGEDADLQEVYETERQLLYVACTRARDYLLVTGTSPASEFLDDLMAL